MLNNLISKDGSVTTVAAPVGQEKYYVLPICSQERHLHFQEKIHEKSGKTIKQDVHES